MNVYSVYVLVLSLPHTAMRRHTHTHIYIYNIADMYVLFRSLKRHFFLAVYSCSNLWVVRVVALLLQQQLELLFQLLNLILGLCDRPRLLFVLDARFQNALPKRVNACLFPKPSFASQLPVFFHSLLVLGCLLFLAHHGQLFWPTTSSCRTVVFRQHVRLCKRLTKRISSSSIGRWSSSAFPPLWLIRPLPFRFWCIVVSNHHLGQLLHGCCWHRPCWWRRRCLIEEQKPSDNIQRIKSPVLGRRPAFLFFIFIFIFHVAGADRSARCRDGGNAAVRHHVGRKGIVALPQSVRARCDKVFCKAPCTRRPRGL